MWKGVVALGDERVPVKLYAAAIDRRVHFRLLHAADGQPVQQRMVHPGSGEPVSRDEVRRAFEVERGVLVALSGDELESLESPRAERTIETVAFVPPAAIPPAYVDRPYYLGPDGDQEAYLALVAALARRERAGIVRWVMRNKRYVGALRAREPGQLLLVTLRRHSQVVEPGAVESPGGRALDEKERRLARQLIDALAGPFEPERYSERYSERVRELVEAKAAGRKVEARPPRRKKPARSLERALSESVRAAKERSVA